MLPLTVADDDVAPVAVAFVAAWTSKNIPATGWPRLVDVMKSVRWKKRSMPTLGLLRFAGGEYEGDWSNNMIT